MKASKKQTGTKLKLTKGKRVSLRCPLSIEQTDIEYNYDASAVQVCMTVENMGGGGLTDDTVAAAVIVVRLFDGEGKIIPCMGDSEYFAKLLRFGEEGLRGGEHITFRLTLDCGPEGLHTEDAEVYISRVRYADETVTDYVRGDFFDFPDNGILIAKRFKKNEAEVAAALGEGAVYVPEHLTEIVWRCTCGEFSESDACPSCGRNKAKLFGALAPFVSAVAAPVNASADGAQADADASLPPVSDQTAEYPTGPALAAAKAAMESDAAAPPVYPSRPKAQEKKSDKTKAVLLVSIAAAAVVLGVLILILALTLANRSKPAQTTTGDSAVNEQPITSDAGAQIVHSYISQHDYKNALGYAQSVGASEELIEEIYDSAIAYYTEQHLYEEALEWALLANDEEVAITLRAILFSQKLSAEDYEGAIELANTLPEGQREASLAEAASGYVNSLVAQGKYNEAMEIADQYQTELTSAQIAATAIDGYLQNHEFDTAITLAQQLGLSDKTVECQKAAAEFYIGLSDYDRAIGYAKTVGDSTLLEKIFPHLSDLQIRRNLPTFFSDFLTFEQKQAVHATPVSSNPQKVVAIDEEGNVYEGDRIVYYAAGGGSPAVSVVSSDTTIVALLENGMLYYIKGYNSYFSTSDVAGWTNVVAIAMSNYHILGLTASGEVLAAGKNLEGQCNVTNISNAVAIAAGDNHSVILLADGTVVAVGTTVGGICETSAWSDIVAVSAGFLHTVGLKADGTAVALGNCKVDEWTDVIAIASEGNNVVGIQQNGTLVYSAAGTQSDLLADVSDAVGVSVGKNAIVVLHEDGTLTAHGQNAPDVSLLAEVERKTEVFGMR